MNATSGHVQMYDPVARAGDHPHRWRPLIGATLLVTLFALGGTLPASAHEGGSTDVEGYVLVQQAIGYLLNVDGPEGTMHAQEKITAALSASDREGVATDEVTKAQAQLAAGQRDVAITTLQGSISEAVKSLPPATGEETGTGTVLAPLAAAPISAAGWGTLVAAFLVIVVGVWLSVRFRPEVGLHELRSNLGVGPHHADRGGAPKGIRR